MWTARAVAGVGIGMGIGVPYMVRDGGFSHGHLAILPGRDWTLIVSGLTCKPQDYTPIHSISYNELTRLPRASWAVWNGEGVFVKLVNLVFTVIGLTHEPKGCLGTLSNMPGSGSRIPFLETGFRRNTLFLSHLSQSSYQVYEPTTPGLPEVRNAALIHQPSHNTTDTVALVVGAGPAPSLARTRGTIISLGLGLLHARIRVLRTRGRSRGRVRKLVFWLH